MRTCLTVLMVIFLFLVTGMIHADPPASEPATQPSKLATERADALKKDIENFMLLLNYYGEEDKNRPYYRLLLTVPPPPARSAVPFDQLYVHITTDQAKKIIDYLTTEGFLDRAKLPDRPTKPSVPPQGPTYVLSRWSDLSENLGWGLPMLQRLDGLRTVLDGEAAKKMDVLLERMAGEREAWKKPAATQPGVGLSKLVGQEVTLTGTYGGGGKPADYITLNATEEVYFTGKRSGLTPKKGQQIQATGILRYHPGSNGPPTVQGIPAHYFFESAVISAAAKPEVVTQPATAPATQPPTPQPRGDLTLEDFRKIRPEMTLQQVYAQVGPPVKDIGSGLYILVYTLSDGTTVLVSSTGRKIVSMRYKSGQDYVELLKPNSTQPTDTRPN